MESSRDNSAYNHANPLCSLKRKGQPISNHPQQACRSQASSSSTIQPPPAIYLQISQGLPALLHSPHDQSQSSNTIVCTSLFHHYPVPNLASPINTSFQAFHPSRFLHPNLAQKHQPAPLGDQYPLLTLKEQRHRRNNSSGDSLALHNPFPSHPLNNTYIDLLPRTCPPHRPLGPASTIFNPTPHLPTLSMSTPHPPDLERALPATPIPATHSPTNPHNHPNPSPAAESPPWGPSHPCFPHPNPHLPLSSPLHSLTRIIRIPRDWFQSGAGDLAPQFSHTYPEILAPWVSETDFRSLVKEINERLMRAYDPWAWANWVDAVLGVMTGWVWEDLKGGVSRERGRRGVKEVEHWVEGWNRRRIGHSGEKEDEELVRAVELRRTGFMSLDIQIPDPHVGLLSDAASAAASASAEQRPQTAISPVDEADECVAEGVAGTEAGTEAGHEGGAIDTATAQYTL